METGLSAQKSFSLTTNFERAIFFSWGCAIGDCAFCYMSTQKEKHLRQTRRGDASILAECIIAKNCGWDIGFFTGGIGVLSDNELISLLKSITEIIDDKIWLSIGPLSTRQLQMLKPYLKGVVGSTETVNCELHKKICPSKPLKPYERLFEEAQKLGLRTAMTFIVGLGEKKEDIELLKEFIQKYSISKIHIYGLIPQKGTLLQHYPVPSKEDQVWWISQVRAAFPAIDIQCGIWDDRAERIHDLLLAGANTISKFQAIKLFGTPVAKQIEQEAALAGRTFTGTLTKLPDVDWDLEVSKLSLPQPLKTEVKKKLQIYIRKMQR